MPAAERRRLVALSEPPGPAFTAALAAAWERGDAVLPLDPRAPGPERERVLHEMRPDLPVDAEVALVITTSGSTGAPKGAQLTHAALEASARATMARIGLEAGDHWLSCLPWHHIGGLQVLLRARLFGTPLTVHDSFDVRRIAAESAATLVSLVPTQLVRLLDAGVDLARFRVILVGGAGASPALLDRAANAGGNVVTTYGMSETAGGCVYDGVPLDGVDVGVDGQQRIRLRGPMLMSGYRLRPDLTAPALVDGWLVTNDIGSVDAGRLVVSGRADDVIVTGGENVAADVVTHALLEHPAVLDAFVTGVDDDEWGQRVVAVVVAGRQTPSLADVRTWCADRLPPAAVPRELIVVDRIPRLSTGKVDRLAVRAAVAQTTGTRVPLSSTSGDPPSKA